MVAVLVAAQWKGNYVVISSSKAVIENDLKGTEFENYTRIYDENSE